MKKNLIKVEIDLNDLWTESEENVTDTINEALKLAVRDEIRNIHKDTIQKYSKDVIKEVVINNFDEIISDKFANLRELIPNKLKDYNKQKQLSERFLDLLEIIFRDMLLIKQNLDSLLYLELRYSKIKELSEKYISEGAKVLWMNWKKDWQVMALMIKSFMDLLMKP